MSYGFEATNSSGQVLISSEFKNLHFKEKKTSPTFTDLNSNGLFGGVKVMRYRFYLSETPVPFFHVPSLSRCAVTAVRSVSPGVWDIEVLTDGANPEIYIFATSAVTSSGDTHGVQVFNSSNQVTFDSRAAPLIVTGLYSVSPPPRPKINSYLSSGLSSNQCSTGVGTYHSRFTPDYAKSYSADINYKPLFFFASNAQAHRQIHVSTSETVCDGISVKGNCVGFERDYYYDSYYWAFYRNVIFWEFNWRVASAWTVASWGCNWEYETDSSAFGIGTGGSSSSGGAWPYTNETINTFNNTIIMGNASFYD